MLRTVVLALVIACSLVNSAPAGIMLSYASSTSVPLVASSHAYLDVFVRSSDGTDLLDGFQVEFGLSSAGGPVGGLRFVDPQSNAQLLAGNYVFNGRSLSANTGATAGVVSALGSIFTGYDATDDGSGIPLVGNPDPLSLGTSDRLLFRLEFEADFSGDYVLDLNFAEFFSDQLDPVLSLLPNPVLPGPYLLKVSGGTAAVPEPGTVGAIALLATAWFTRRKLPDRDNRENTI